MNIALVRRWYTAKSTTGEMLIDGRHQCYSLERPDLNNAAEVSCIPEGGYDLSLYFSSHNKRWVPLLHDVPQRSMIEIHPANYPHELKGCIAPGVTRDIDAVYASVAAFEVLYKKIKAAIDDHEAVRIVISRDSGS